METAKPKYVIERDEEQKANLEAVELLRKVAVFFPDYLFSFEDENNFRFCVRVWGEHKNIKGASLIFGYDHKKKTIAVMGSYPRGVKGEILLYNSNYGTNPQQEYPASINVSIKKTAEQIAKDIERRFMGDHDKAIKLALTRLDKQTRKQNSRETLLAELAGIMGVEHYSEKNKEENRSVEQAHIHRYYGSDNPVYSMNIKTDYAGQEVSFDLQVTPDVARKICAVLGEVI
jgi:hypothetical protein